MKHPPIYDQLEAHRTNSEAFDEIRPILAENKKLREALRGLLDCGNAILGASTSDGAAAEAFDMYNEARLKARRALALSSHHNQTEAK